MSVGFAGGWAEQRRSTRRQQEVCAVLPWCNRTEAVGRPMSMTTTALLTGRFASIHVGFPPLFGATGRQQPEVCAPITFSQTLAFLEDARRVTGLKE